MVVEDFNVELFLQLLDQMEADFLAAKTHKLVELMDEEQFLYYMEVAYRVQKLSFEAWNAQLSLLDPAELPRYVTGEVPNIEPKLRKKTDGSVELLERPFMCYRCKVIFLVDPQALTHSLKTGQEEPMQGSKGLRHRRDDGGCGALNHFGGKYIFMYYTRGRKLKTAIGIL